MIGVAVLLGAFWTGTAVAFVITGVPPAMVEATGHPTNVTGALDLVVVVTLGLVGIAAGKLEGLATEILSVGMAFVAVNLLAGPVALRTGLARAGELQRESRRGDRGELMIQLLDHRLVQLAVKGERDVQVLHRAPVGAGHLLVHQVQDLIGDLFWDGKGGEHAKGHGPEQTRRGRSGQARPGPALKSLTMEGDLQRFRIRFRLKSERTTLILPIAAPHPRLDAGR